MNEEQIQTCGNCLQTQMNDGPFCNETPSGLTMEVDYYFVCDRWKARV